MTDFRIGYLYSLAPIHCGGKGDLGNILEIAREVHTNFPYVPGSSLRGSLRDEVTSIDPEVGDKLFGKELNGDGQMGVHQVWFGDARLLWIPMRTMSLSGGKDIFTWVSCHSLIRDRALIAGLPAILFPDRPVGTQPGNYTVADAQIQVAGMNEEQKQAIALYPWANSLETAVKPTWETNRIVLPDADFQVLMEHSLWTQVRNKIEEKEGSAEVFWTDVCIPRDTILYYSWGYDFLQNNPVTSVEHEILIDVIQGLFQVGGQANIGRGWVQGWVNNNSELIAKTTAKSEAMTV